MEEPVGALNLKAAVGLSTDFTGQVKQQLLPTGFQSVETMHSVDPAAFSRLNFLGPLNLEKAVETADAADDADRQGLEVKRPRTCEVTPKPSMDSVVQPLHLRNPRHLRLNELPVLG